MNTQDDQPVIRPERWFLFLLLVLAVVFLAMIPFPRADGHLLGSDGGYYYSYMRSWWLDGDVDIQNDVALYNSRMTEENPNRIRVLYDRSIGPGVLWSPFFLVARGVTWLMVKTGVPLAGDGFSYQEEAAVCLGSIFYGVLGLYLLYRLLAGYVSQHSALYAVLAMTLTTFVLYYLLFEPSMGHALELFTVSFFMWALLRPHHRLCSWWWVGVAAGLMSLVRWQNSVFLLLVPYAVFFPAGRASTTQRKQWWLTGGLVALGWGVLMLLQGLFWQAALGRFITVPQGSGFLTPFHPYLFEVLFSTRHGLLSWHPVFLLAGIGLCCVRPWRLLGVLVLLIAVQLYVCSIVSEWWCADSFGLRRMTGTVPMFAFGLAFLRERWTGEHRLRKKLLTAALIILAGWNLLFMAQYRLALIPAGEALSTREMTIGKLDVFTKGFSKVRGMLR